MLKQIQHTVWAVACLAVFSVAPESEAQSGSGSSLTRINDDLIEVFEKVSPSVVVIKVTKEVPQGMDETMFQRFGFDFFLRDQREEEQDDSSDQGIPVPRMPETEGSGIIYDRDGHIITNYHVIDTAQKIDVILKDGRTYEANLVGADQTTDIAVLKIKADDLVPASFADSDKVRIGQLACAIGAPYELDYSFTLGVVSGLKRSNLLSGGRSVVYEEYIQSDASINPGNSGGPLIDIEGNVIGINTLINGINRGLSFSIPSNIVKKVAGQLIEKGSVEWSWVGIRIETLSKSSGLGKHFEGIDSGVIVETIEPDTPAYRSELRPADVIVAVDRQPVVTAQELQKRVLEKPVGSTVDLKVWRDGKFLVVDVVTAARPEATAMRPPVPPVPDDEGSEPNASLSSFGLSVQKLDKELAERMDLNVSAGLLVTEVKTDTPADIAGILPQDVITEVNSRKVTSVEDFSGMIAQSDPGRGILLFIDRDGEKTYAVLKNDS